MALMNVIGRARLSPSEINGRDVDISRDRDINRDCSYGEQCIPGKPVVTQQQTGKQVKGVPVWNVTVANECPCSYSAVVLTCDGISRSRIPLNPAVVTVSGDLCNINNESTPIFPNTQVSFTYAAQKVNFELSSYQESCS
nr:uncharacterized protein LOC117274644 [Nicotiana tomentosiformis]